LTANRPDSEPPTLLASLQRIGQTSSMATMDLLISDLAQDSIERSRPHLDPDRVEYYRQHLDEATPIVVFDVDGDLLLADGHHRVAAAELLGRSTVRADVRKGKRRDALKYAVEQVKQQRGLTDQQITEAIARRSPRPE
jgi:hypothetical protein